MINEKLRFITFSSERTQHFCQTPRLDFNKLLSLALHSSITIQFTVAATLHPRLSAGSIAHFVEPRRQSRRRVFYEKKIAVELAWMTHRISRIFNDTASVSHRSCCHWSFSNGGAVRWLPGEKAGTVETASCQPATSGSMTSGLLAAKKGSE